MLPPIVFSEVDLVLHLETEFRESEEREEDGHKHSDIEMRIVAKMEGSKVESEEALDEEPREVNALNTEEAARQHNDEEGEAYAWNPAQALIELLEEELVSTDEDALQGTINYEVPRSPVPQTADKEAEPQVEIFAGFGLHSTTTQGKIEIVLDEHTEGLVPPTPKLRNRGGHIRVVEVFREFEAHHAT